MTVHQFLLALIAIFVGAKLFGTIAERLGQPAVLGELIAGILVGKSVLGLVDPAAEGIRLLAELGVILLLFEIGLETNLRRLLRAGPSAVLVAIVGITVPFALGYLVAGAFGYSAPVAIFLGASLTATSVGITARVLSDLGRLADAESQIILGAAVLDDILGLVILAIVGGVAAGRGPTPLGVFRIAASALGFVAAAIVIGSWMAPWFLRLLNRVRTEKLLLFFALVFAFLLADLAEVAGSALIVGAFAAGLVLAQTKEAGAIVKDVRGVAHFFVPIFFVSVGAAVDVGAFDLRAIEGRRTLLAGFALLAVGVFGKLVSGLVIWKPGVRRLVVGVGMVPRGEVGLIFARIGLAAGLLTPGLYGSVAFMVLGTSLVAPPWLRFLLGPPATGAGEPGAVADLATSPPFGEDDGVESREE